MKKLNIFLFLTLIALSANEEDRFVTTFDSGRPLLAEHSIPIISQSARDGDSWKFTLSANFNEYQATGDSLEIAYVASTLDGFFSSYKAPNGSIIVLDFDYHPGFQVGFVLGTPYDDWNFGGGYLWYRGHSHASANAKTDIYYQAPILVGPFNDFLTSLSADWHLDIDLFDLYLSRAYLSGKKLELLPFLGLKSGWIRQDLDFTSIIWPTTTNIQTATTDSNAWLIGPEIGFQGKFLINYGFSIFSNIATSLLYSKYNTLSLNYLSNVSETSFLNNDALSTFRSIMDAGLGINWESKGKYRINVNAAYNLSVFFSQNMDRVLVGLASGHFIAPGNLYLSGLSVGASFVF